MSFHPIPPDVAFPPSFTESEKKDKLKYGRQVVTLLAENGVEIIGNKVYAQPHTFIPFPNPYKRGCVKCDYHRNHRVHI